MFGSARIPRLVFGTSVFGFLAVCSFAWADVNPSPLQSAYWRFEQGPNGSLVNSAASDTVLDSINANHLSAFNTNTAPTYTNSVPPKALRSGAANTLALSFTADAGGGSGDDLFTRFSPGKPINNGTIAAGGGFTVEAAFKTNNPALFAGIVGKEGQPGGSRPQPTFVLKTRADNSLLQVEQWDGAANLVQVSSLAPLVAGQWYYTAVVNTGSTLSLYLDSGSGYQLQGSVPVSGALYQGNPASPNWDNSWTVGRGQFNGAPADWFNGIIDEVRLTNSALSPSQFVFNTPVVGQAGDFNNDGKVDAADYVTWRKNNGTNNALPNDNGLGTPVGPAHYNLWRANFGAGAGSGLDVANVPEPRTFVVLCGVALVFVAGRRRPSHCARPASTEEPAIKRTEEAMEGTLNRTPRPSSWLLFVSAVVALSLASSAIADVAPNPLQSAYWRFEEGPLFSTVSSAATDPVHDSINQNHLDAFKLASEPTYVNSTPPTPLKSGAPNNFALDFIPHADDPNTPQIDPGGDDLFTQYNTGEFGKGAAKSINDGIIAPGGGLTIEASFTSNQPAAFRAIIGKEARPQGSRPLETFVLKTYGAADANQSKVFAEFFDGGGNMKQLFSTSPLAIGQWYSVAIVDNGTTASMYLNSHNGSGYLLQQSVAVSGALFQGNPANPLWDASWTVGRGQFAGNPADWWDGMIDEVRISNTALAPSQFLFAPAGGGAGSGVPEPASFVLGIVSSVAMLFGRRRQRSSRGK